MKYWIPIVAVTLGLSSCGEREDDKLRFPLQDSSFTFAQGRSTLNKRLVEPETARVQEARLIGDCYCGDVIAVNKPEWTGFVVIKDNVPAVIFSDELPPAEFRRISPCH